MRVPSRSTSNGWQAKLVGQAFTAVAALIAVLVCAPQPTAAQAPMVFDFEPTEEELATPSAPAEPSPAPKKAARAPKGTANVPKAAAAAPNAPVAAPKPAAKNKPAAKSGVRPEPIAPVPDGIEAALPNPAGESAAAAAPAKAKRAKKAAGDEAASRAESDTAKAPRPRANAKSASKPNARVAKARRGRQPTPAYQKLRDSWQQPVDPALVVPPLEVTGRVPLVLSQVNGGLVVTIVPQREDGGFSEADVERAAKVFAPRDMEGHHPIAPRLLDLMYRAMRHFQVPMVHVVSGYRKDRAGSRHTQGRAVDMVLPGVSNDALAEYVRSFGYCGVGVYTKSGFVHLDVRDKSYFWLDHSLPGERSRSTPILPEAALDADRNAAARGEAPDVYVPNNDREDRAAAKAYARRARLRRQRAQRQLANAQARAGGGAPMQGRAKPKPSVIEANMFGGLPP